MYHVQAHERCFFFPEEQKISCPITLVPVQHIHTGVHVCLIHKRINLHLSSQTYRRPLDHTEFLHTCVPCAQAQNKTANRVAIIYM